MSDLFRCPSRSSSLVSVPAGHDVQPVDRFSHPLSSDADDSAVHVLVTQPSLENVDSTCFGRHKAASIRSFKRDAPISTHRKTKSSVGMERTGSSSAPTPPNGRNLIFDEWITSTAHPALAAHELIPPELIDDEKAIQDMMAEAMTEETFCFVPLAEEIVAPVVEEAKIPEVSVSVSTCEIPPKDMQIPSRPRSTSSLSLRKWAEMIVGRGETTRRPATASSTPPISSKTGPARSFSAPEKPRSIEEGIEVPNLNASPAPNTNATDVPAEPHNPPTSKAISPSSSNISVTSLNGPPASDPSPQLPSTHDSLSRVYSAPVEEIPTLEQMRTGVVKSIHTFRSPTRLRATTLTADTTRSRSGSESTPPKQPVLSQSSSTTSLTSWGQRSPVPVVEMNKIVPPGMQPPSQSAKWDDHYHSAQKGLTDRYGFVYAGERRRSGGVLDLRESLREQTRSDEERWKDVVNEAEERIDELRKQGAKEKHVPPSFSEGWNSRVKADPVQGTVAMTERTVQSSSLNPAIPPSSPNETQSVELPPKISPESIIPIADPAPLTPSLSVPTPPIPTLSNPTDLSTIKLLLSKLNDLHDSLDRANRQRWDKWLSQSDLTDSLLTPSHNVKDRKQRLKDFKSLVIGGIPVKYRSKIWAECSGALELSRPGYFEELCNLGTKDLDQICVQQIEMDIHRTMPNNVFFGGNGPGIPKLERVLIAFARHNPEIGYCQGSMIPR
jgi:Rab-GTPase-TBC domain